MTKVERTMIEVCCFCYDFHHKYIKNVDFKYARKEAVTNCRFCEQAMCSDCQASSQKELQGDYMGMYWLTMCQCCITQIRRSTLWHKEYEALAKKWLELFKASLRKEIYTLTQTKQCH